MELATLVQLLDEPAQAEVLGRWGLRDPLSARQMLVELAQAGVPLDLVAELCCQLQRLLPSQPSPDEQLAALADYLRAVRSPLALLALMQRDVRVLPKLLATLGLGPWCREWLLADPELLDLLGQSPEPLDRRTLSANLEIELSALGDLRLVEAALVRFRRRHLVRVAYGELVERRPLSWVEQQLADVAEALIEAAFTEAIRQGMSGPWGLWAGGRGLEGAGGSPPACPFTWSVIGTGDLGAGQLHYQLPLTLLCVYQPRGTVSQERPLYELAERIARIGLRLLEDSAQQAGGGAVQRIALPDSPLALTAHLADDVVYGLESFGRTWHRQQMLWARVVAGDRALGESVLARLKPWLFRRYLSPADETGMRALKRRNLQTAQMHRDDWQDVVAARGGLRDLGAAIAFLQLMAGGDDPGVRVASTRAALEGLTRSGTLTAEEAEVLRGSDQWLRRLEHALQVHQGLSQTRLPEEPPALDRLADALGVAGGGDSLLAEHRRQLERCWQTVHKLLASAFPQEGFTPREVDLLLDPAPTEEEVRAALKPFGFADPRQALATLHDLAREQVPFLSTRKCRYLLSEILPSLLCAVAATPSPDATLDRMARVSASLGGKATLWELFRTQPLTMHLYVKLCAASPYLAGILTANPGMLDELIDSLQRDKLPTCQELEATWAVWRRGTAQPLRLLHDLKSAAHLWIGVRDILGKDDIEQTAAALSDVACVCLKHLIDREWAELLARLGVSPAAEDPAAVAFEGLAVLGLGRLGARELNYHSQLPLLFVYGAEGTTQPTAGGHGPAPTTQQHLFTQLVQRVVKRLTELTPQGRLYPTDVLLRPLGIGGGRAISLDELVRHFEQPDLPIGSWVALCQARVVYGPSTAARSMEAAIQRLLRARAPQPGDAAAVAALRDELARGATPRNLKRAAGGTLDITLAVALLQLRHAASHPQVLCPGTLPALAALAKAGLLPADSAELLDHHFRFLRRLEAGLRLLDTARRHDLPEDEPTLAQLALLVGHANPRRLAQQCQEVMAQTREVFRQIVTDHGGPSLAARSFGV